MITVQQLIDYLVGLNKPEVEVLFELFSDYAPLKLEDIGEPVLAVQMGQNHWITRFHDSMDEELKKKAKEYLIFPGN